ncbi:MAG: molybdate ABC transporter substrate-binding protein [Terriglobia bacterium]
MEVAKVDTQPGRSTGPGRIKGAPALVASAILLVVTIYLSGCASLTDNEQAGSSGSTPNRIKIAAASDLQPAFEELAVVLKNQRGVEAVFVFGSSGQLAEQIVNGAGVDMYASANEDYVDKVIKAEKASATSRQHYAVGRLVIISGDADREPPPIGSAEFENADRLAIANPSHAPYGQAAKEALEAGGLWQGAQQKLVFGENARQAYQYAATGNVDLAIVPLSLAIAGGREYRPVPARLHNPINQTLVAVGQARRQETDQFIALLKAKAGQRIMAKYGFAKPQGGDRP